MLDVNLVTNLYTCWGATQSARQCWRLKLKSYILVLLSFRSRYNWYPGQSNTAPTSKQLLQHKESLHFKDMKNLCVKQQPKRLAYSTVQWYTFPKFSLFSVSVRGVVCRMKLYEACCCFTACNSMLKATFHIPPPPGSWGQSFGGVAGWGGGAKE